MPIVVAWIGEMLLSVVGQLAMSALVSIGIGFVGSKVVGGVLDVTGIAAMFSQAGQLTAFIGWMGIDKFVTIILSAWAGRAIVSAARLHLARRPT